MKVSLLPVKVHTLFRQICTTTQCALVGTLNFSHLILQPTSFLYIILLSRSILCITISSLGISLPYAINAKSIHKEPLSDHGSSVITDCTAAFDPKRCVIPIIDDTLSDTYYSPTLTTRCLSAEGQKVWPILLEVDHLTQVHPRFFSTVSKGAVTSLCRTNANSLSSTPLPILSPSSKSTTTLSNLTIATSHSTLFNIKTLNLALFFGPKQARANIHSPYLSSNASSLRTIFLFPIIFLLFVNTVSICPGFSQSSALCSHLQFNNFSHFPVPFKGSQLVDSVCPQILLNMFSTAGSDTKSLEEPLVLILNILSKFICNLSFGRKQNDFP